MLFASLLYVIFSGQLDGSLKSLFQSVKKLQEKKPQTLINSDLKKHSNVDFSETKKIKKRVKASI